MKEAIRKAAPYLAPSLRYWHAVPPEQVAAGAYPLDFTRHLREGHYQSVDSNGIPVRPMRGAVIHNYTRIAGYALAHLQAYEASAGPAHRAAAVAAGRYFTDTGHHANGELELRAEVPGKGHSGTISAMAQGQAVSVLSRLYRLTGADMFAEAALASLGPFRRTVGEGGVVGRLRAAGGTAVTWYEEEAVEPLSHILNGMVFAVWGLIDASEILQSSEAAALADRGLESIRLTAGQFDSGHWSWYDDPDDRRPYPASASYHQLHIAQLRDVGRRTGDQALTGLARTFSAYERSLACRARAISDLLAARARGGRRAAPGDRAVSDSG